ncbi:hypothetical protein DL238_03400 [Alteriqipengyuania lutimaris]|uniref:Class I SAM-dependent methyltransferase n=2 Tax=Alteriqipengyuania lutimaris TaxID=1538146 RepID=A0A395LIE7_9SPHN|nr:hypothetical protein DL238_03400 [Alteriqipengyuania lutimaris]
MVSGLMRISVDKRPSVPWISYDAQALLDMRLNKSMRMLEYGSGMSTVWYAERVGHVVSIDDFHPWYEKVKANLESRGVQNVTYRYAEGVEDYCSPTEQERDGGFDFIMIDGSYRDTCAQKALELINPGGMIYLDNADRSHTDPRDGDAKLAREILLAHADKVGADIRWFTDFAPTQFAVTGGLLVTLPES